MPPRKERVKPTHYPTLPFHILRTAQLISAIIVSSIMSYFIWQLQHDHYRLPWTFILLLTVSLLTILFLSITIVLHCFYGLNPLLNTSLNGILFVLWGLGFALLTWWTSGTLAHVCSVENWEDDAGITICRIYKALFSFSLFGVLSTILALLLDIHVRRKSTYRGKFTALQSLDSKHPHTTHSHASDRHLPLHGEEANLNPATGYDHTMQTGRGGYAVPDEQFTDDDDIAYRGATGEMGRSLENRS